MREAYYIKGEGVCKYEIDEKSGGSEAWTVIREEGKLVFCARHTWLERYIDRCVPEIRSRGPTHTAGGRPKEK